jgi:hypothetical protein
MNAEREALAQVIHDEVNRCQTAGQCPFDDDEVRRVTDAVLAHQQERAGTTVTDWGVRWFDVTGTGFRVGEMRHRDPGDMPYTKESALLDSPPGTVVVSRTRTYYADVVSDWSPLTS